MEDIFRFSEEPESIIERFILPAATLEKRDYGVCIQGGTSINIYFGPKQYDVSIQKCSFVNHFNKVEEVLLLDLSLTELSRNLHIYLEFEFSYEK
ncbi:hypothetical protein [Niallia circulans]|uniref:Uncharacterized protein n=1 Tax=Niallia circulans TaxID=1397 RepID=A0A941JLL7_NIACI|nr:hypothetical protein [Niallia circulans]MCB5237508.1 hypothetical protein [Niallia circulans]